MARPMLDDLELQQVQTIQQDGDQVWTQHSIPGLEGDFFQGLGRRASQITLTGVLTGAEVADGLKSLRDKFRAAEPVAFVADIATATRIDQVLIEEMGVRELAGKPARFEYAFTLREYTPATPTQVIIPPPPPPPPPPQVEKSVLEVEVIVEGQENFDHSQTTVRVEGDDQDGNRINQTLTQDQRTDNKWEVDPFPAGRYTAFATTVSPVMTGASEEKELPLGGRETLTVRLRAGQLIAVRHRITYWFDKAFIEPCQRDVLRRVAARVQSHPDEKLVIVGHTDESGSAQYNQSLSERRARGAYAFLTFGRDGASADAAVAEWDELRKARTVGVARTVRDTWGPRQYSQMLQDLGFYKGNITDSHTPAVDQAVRDFQTANGLGVDGDVGDQTWPVLIRAYLAQDNLAVPEDRLMPNAKDGCDHGFVRWLGCGEKFPEPTTPRPCGEPGWRPNRRTDFLFVTAAEFPCEVPKPATFELPTANSGGSGWCLGPDQGDNPTSPCCFITHDPKKQDQWLITEAEPETFEIHGRIQFEDGSPLANTPFVLTASDGEFMDGEQTCGATGVKGTPIPGRTDADGRFAYPGRKKPVGIYSLEVQADPPVVARLKDQPITAARGPVVCNRLEEETDFVVVVVGQGVVSVQPGITPASNLVVVKKPHTNPQRVQVTLRANQGFTGNGTFTRSNDAIRFFDAATGGNEITFDGVDNVFSGAQLSAGVLVFAEGSRASAAVDDVELRLALTVNGTPGLAATAKMTAVSLTLDVFMSRTDDAVLPAPLAQPPAAPPGGAANDKWFGGRFVHLQDPGHHQGRALIVVQPVQPAGVTADLQLRQVAIAGNAVGALDNKLQVFDNEFFTAGEAAKGNPHEFAAGSIPAGGQQFWVEGQNVSAALRDTGFQLGIKNLEPDGDRVSLTVVRFRNLQASIPSNPPNTARLGNNPVPNSTFSRGTAAALVATDYDVDFTANAPFALVENSLPAGTNITMTVAVEPAGVPVSWAVHRDNRPAPQGDNPRIAALSPNPVPTLVQDGGNPLQATLAADAVGSFHIRPYVDCNANNIFDLTRNSEPFILVNTVLIRVGGAGSVNNSRAQPANIGFGSFAGGRPAPGAAFAPTSATGLRVVTGNFTGPATAGVFNDATMVVTGGGDDGLRGLNNLFAGWINNELAVATSITAPPGEDVVAEYRDTTVAPPQIHRRTSVWTSPGGQTFSPATGGPAALIPGPVLDTTNFGNEGTGGNRAVGTEGAVGPPVPITRTPHVPTVGLAALGETWRVQMWDSPGDSAPPAHGFLPGALSAYRFNLDFQTELVFWTNVTGVPGPTPGPITGAAPPTPDAACCLYASSQVNTWQIRISFTFHPVTGASTPGANTITLQRDANPVRLAQPVASEIRAPVSLNLLSIDASA